MKKTLLIILVILVGLACICAAVGGIYLLTRQMAAGNSWTLLPAPLRKSEPVVSAVTPITGSEYQINDYVPLQANASAQTEIRAFEVWIDGKIFAQKQGLENSELKELSAQWVWQPATVGEHTLLFRAVDRHGLSGYSATIVVNAGEAVSAVQAVKPTKNGQTLVDIAQIHQVDEAAVMAFNPTIDPGEPLDSGQYIKIPHAPPPVIGVDLSGIPTYIPDLPEKDGGAGNQIISLLPGPLQKVVVPLLPAESGGTAPTAPTLVKAEVVNQCDIHLEFKDNSDIEDGFKVYRAGPTVTSFALVADLPPMITKNPEYSDTNIHIKGARTYIISAYNEVGESKSLPVVVNVSDPACFPAETEDASLPVKVEPGVKLTVDPDELLVIQTDKEVDLAYAYLTVNGKTFRVPEMKHDTFLKGSGYNFDLSAYLLEIVEYLPATTDVYHVTVELWGWDGYKPYLAGSYSKVIEDFVILLGCQITAEEACDSDASDWTKDITIDYKTPAERMNFRFKVVSLKPYADNIVRLYYANKKSKDPNNLFSVSFENVSTDLDGNPAYQPAYFTVELGQYFDYLNTENVTYYNTGICPDKEKPCKADYFGRLYRPTDPFKIAVDVTTCAYTCTTTSNRVKIYNQLGSDASEESKYTYTPKFPDLYQVEFLEDTYTPAVNSDPTLWGCIQYLEPADGFAAGEIRCPDPKPEDPCKDSFSWSCFVATAEGVGETFTDMYDTLTNAFSEAFTWVVDGIVSVIPGCDGSDTCKWIVNKVCEVAWTYMTGLPTDLPNSSQIASAGLDYAVDLAVDQTLSDLLSNPELAGLLPDEVKNYLANQTDEFKTALESQLMVQFLASKRPAAGHNTLSCLYPQVANSRGKLPLCPSGAWDPAPGSQIAPPTVQVKITRKAITDNNNFGTDASTARPEYNEFYALRITSSTVNDYRVGSYIPLFGGYRENYQPSDCPCTTILSSWDVPACDFDMIYVPCSFQVKLPLQGSLYEDIEIPIPWMEVGESITYTITFRNRQFFEDKHQYWLSEIGYDRNSIASSIGDDWRFFYYYGQTTLKAEEVCYSNVVGRSFCGSSDTFNPEIPVP